MSGASYPTIPAKTIVTRTKNTGWFGTDYNMNIYRGCSHGCIYCDSRSDCYQNPNFDIVKVKENALAIIRDDLRRKVRTGVIGTGAMSDPYNPLEGKLELTRNALQLVSAYQFGVAIDTKSPLVTRDIDILAEISEHSPVIVKVTVTAADDTLCRKIEPVVAPTGKRIEAIKALSAAGIFTGILMMPLLPFISDTRENVAGILDMAAANGARFVFPAFGLTMRDGQREHFYTQLDKDFPGMRQRYEQRYDTRYNCPSPGAGELYGFFKERCGQLGLLHSMRDITAGYKMGYSDTQLTFF